MSKRVWHYTHFMPISMIVSKGTGKIFGGGGLGLELKIPEESEELSGVETEDKLLEIPFEEFVDGGLGVGPLRSRVDEHWFII